MAYREEWARREDENGTGLGASGMGALRIALLFGSAAVALALIVAPIAETRTAAYVHGNGDRPALDFMATGTVGQRNGGSYTVRRSVLQPLPTSVCIIRDNGTRTGDC